MGEVADLNWGTSTSSKNFKVVAANHLKSRFSLWSWNTSTNIRYSCRRIACKRFAILLGMIFNRPQTRKQVIVHFSTFAKFCKKLCVSEVWEMLIFGKFCEGAKRAIPNQVSVVIRLKGESQNDCFKKTKHIKFSEKRPFLTPWYAHVRKFSEKGSFLTTWYAHVRVIETRVLRFALLLYYRRFQA